MLFKKHKSQNLQQEAQTDQSQVHQHYELRKRQVADFLQRQSDKVSIRFKKALLISTGLVLAGLCVGSIFSLTGTGVFYKHLKVGSLTMPRLNKPDIRSDSLLRENENKPDSAQKKNKSH